MRVESKGKWGVRLRFPELDKHGINSVEGGVDFFSDLIEGASLLCE